MMPKCEETKVLVWEYFLPPYVHGLVSLQRRTVKISSEESSANFNVWTQLDEGEKCYQRYFQAVL